MNTTDTTTIELDVFHWVKKLWNAKVLILFSALFVGVLSLLVSVLLLKPTYTSSTRIYVVNQSAESNITTQDLQAGSYLVNDYKEIIKSTSVLTDVISKENLSLSESQLSTMVEVAIPADTRIITISVSSHDAEEAQRLANSLRQVAGEKIKSVTKVEDVTTIEEAKVPEKPTSPNIKRNVLLGVLVGGFLSVAGVLLKELLDDRVRRPEDIEEVLGLVLIGVVPNSEKL